MAKKNLTEYTDEQLAKAETTARKGKGITLGMMAVYVVVLTLLAVKKLFTVLMPLSVILIVLMSSYLLLQRSLNEIDVEKKRRAGL
jgi:cobalamin biosynthesis protein CobD/CbiB